MSNLRRALMIACIFCIGNTYSQEVYHFTKGLMITGAYRYGREALYTDQLAYRLFTHTLQPPSDGATFGNNDRGQSITWQAITADSLNRFRGRGGFGGGGGSYLYLTYESDKEKNALLNVKGNSALFFNGELHTGDAYALGWLYIPVHLKKGINELFIRGGQITADLIFPVKTVSLNTEDPTLPSILLKGTNNSLQGALVVINTSTKELKGLQIKTSLAGKEKISSLPSIPPMSTRKIMFDLDASGVTQKGQSECAVTLLEKGTALDEKKIMLDAVEAPDKYSCTFVSNIDGSLQYYAVTSQWPAAGPGASLFLSVHGAGVEAIGQARAYKSKDWGNLVAATNRRPRGFNWEDWGRLDALEVLAIAKEKFKPDPQHIYLTGHSMGGHGTWFLGATYPDHWAAIGACSGYPTLKGYGSADGAIPDSSKSPMEQMLLRASNPSDVIKLVSNYKPLGVYILHGDQDKVVSVNYARQMRKLLADFHADLSYYEYPNGEHWFGDQSVDWKPLFEFFKWHQLLTDTAVNTIDFTTASPGISSSFRWIAVLQQDHPLEYSHVQAVRNKALGTISVTTRNVQMLSLDLQDFGNNKSLSISVDNIPIKYSTASTHDSICLSRENDQWVLAKKPGMMQKGPLRYGTFKDAFNNRMVFVYGTTGTKEENDWSFGKARFDAETWYYRGNGSVDIITDKEYITGNYSGRSVILFGNASSNGAWKILLKDCPIQVERNKITAGDKSWQGDDLGAYFVWPINGSAINSVSVITGSGIKGMSAASANQYFAGGSGFPDFMIFSLNMLQKGTDEIKMAGFFDNSWKLNSKELISN